MPFTVTAEYPGGKGITTLYPLAQEANAYAKFDKHVAAGATSVTLSKFGSVVKLHA